MPCPTSCSHVLSGFADFSDHRTGSIGITIRRSGAATLMVVEDDGAGLPANFGARSHNSMGLTLAASLAQQLGGKLDFSSSRGCRVEAILTRL